MSICFSSLAAAPRENKEMIQIAKRTLRDYKKLLDNIKGEEDVAQDDLAKTLGETAPAYYVRPK